MEYRIAETEAHFEALADCVERGRLEIRLRDRAEPPDRPALLAMANKKVEALRASPAEAHAWEGVAQFDLVWDGQAARPARGPYLAFMGIAQTAAPTGRSGTRAGQRGEICTAMISMFKSSPIELYGCV